MYSTYRLPELSSSVYDIYLELNILSAIEQGLSLISGSSLYSEPNWCEGFTGRLKVDLASAVENYCLGAINFFQMFRSSTISRFH